MTRRDFQLIAGTLREAKARPSVVAALATALAGTNPRFDRARFLRESGVTRGDKETIVIDEMTQEGA
jgi:hypothetical protein